MLQYETSTVTHLSFLSDILTTLDTIGRQSAASVNLIVGDINFDCTDWQQMALSHYDEAVFLEDLFDQNFQQMIKGQKKHLDVVLTNNADHILNVFVDNKIKQMQNLDHDPFQLKLNASNWFEVGKPKLEVWVHIQADFSIFSYSKTDWNHIEAQIEAHLFLPYCYSNVHVIVDLWYEWLFNIFEENIPKKTKQ